MADSLVNGHERPRLDGSASCPSYYSLGMRRKEAGLAARLPVQIYCNRLDFSERHQKQNECLQNVNRDIGNLKIEMFTTDV